MTPTDTPAGELLSGFQPSGRVGPPSGLPTPENAFPLRGLESTRSGTMDPMNDPLTFTIGHGEYMPRADTYTLLWDPDRMPAVDLSPGAEEAAIRAAGGDPDWFDYPDDAYWHHVVAIKRADLPVAFATLGDAVLFTTPSGDDDLFDYWPSGVRALRAMADALGAAPTLLPAPSIRPWIDGRVAEIIARTPFTADDIGL